MACLPSPQMDVGRVSLPFRPVKQCVSMWLPRGLRNMECILANFVSVLKDTESKLT